MDCYTQVIDALGTPYVKLAASRWREMFRNKLIGRNELSRLAPHIKDPAQNIAKVQQHLQAPAQELAGAALDRYRDLSARQAALKIQQAGGHLTNKPGVGAGSFNGTPFVSPQTGTFIRGIASKNLASRASAQGLLATGKDLPDALYQRIAKPVDKSLFSSVAHHELAEAASQQAAKANSYHPAPVASHLGTAPYLAESLGQRDAEARTIMHRIRANTGYDDPAMYAKLKQHGMVGNYTPPLGGRAHRSLEHQAARLPVNEGAQKRLLTQTRMNIPPNTERKIQNVERAYDAIRKHIPQPYQGRLDAARNEWHNFWAQNTAKPYPFNKDDHEAVTNMLRNFTSL